MLFDSNNSNFLELCFSAQGIGMVCHLLALLILWYQGLKVNRSFGKINEKVQFNSLWWSNKLHVIGFSVQLVSPLRGIFYENQNVLIMSAFIVGVFVSNFVLRWIRGNISITYKLSDIDRRAARA